MTEYLPGAVQWFLFEEYVHAKRVITILENLRITELRTCFSWADWERPGGPEWFDWFVTELTNAGIAIFPSLFYTPLPRAQTLPGAEPRTSYPPADLSSYAAFTREMIEHYGHTFDYIMLWNEPNNHSYWNWQLDPERKLFAEMFKSAAHVARDLGKKVVLPAWGVKDAQWITLMHEYGALQLADAIAIHGFPGTWEEIWYSWKTTTGTFRAILEGLGSQAEIMGAEIGCSSWGSNEEQQKIREQQQVSVFEDVRQALAEGWMSRAYWFSVLDQDPGTPTDNVLNSGKIADVKAYHFGLADNEGHYKILYHHWLGLVKKPLAA